MATLLLDSEREPAAMIGRLVHCNPFLPERIALERQLLGRDFREPYAEWNVAAMPADGANPNLVGLATIAGGIVESVRTRWAGQSQAAWQRACDADPATARAVEETILFVGYHLVRDAIDDHLRGRGGSAAEMYRTFEATLRDLAGGTPYLGQAMESLPHYFAGFVQLRRAFLNIFTLIVGRSPATIALRAAVWQSIFTHDMRRYRLHLFKHMADFTTLITGPSGTGKELVARAIGLSRYVPYLPAAKRFADKAESSFLPIHLAALSPTLIESELFGHARGAFTGAVAERVGWFEWCPATGTVFLDEIGELDPAIQVKLLRVLQQREFSRLGESDIRRFEGKVVAATHRDLAGELAAGRFREDLYYRLCSDRVTVPPLRERLDQNPAELGDLIRALLGRLLDADAKLAETIESAIRDSVGESYAWPGNVRELEQAIRNCLVRGRYTPIARTGRDDPYERLTDRMKQSAIAAEDVVAEYCKLDYARTGNFEETGRRLKLDRRTVRAKVIPGS